MDPPSFSVPSGDPPRFPTSVPVSEVPLVLPAPAVAPQVPVSPARTVPAVPHSNFISGFEAHPKSPYHFGASLGSARPLSSVIPIIDYSLLLPEAVAQARKAPAVRACSSLWVQALDVLASLPEVSTTKVLEAKNHILQGVSTPLLSDPVFRHIANSGSVARSLPACKQQVDEYVTFQALKVLSAPPPIAHPLLAVSKPGKKVRLCLDLARNLNSKVPKVPFKLLAMNAAVDLAVPQCWFTKLDLSSCFLSFPLREDLSSLLNFELQGKFYRFTSMPFGLSSAPRIASLLLDVVSAVLHDLGIRHVRYLDDYLIISASREASLLSTSVAAQVIAAFGLCLNPKKVDGPSQQMTFLGLQLNSIDQTLSLPSDKLLETRELLTSFLSVRSASRKSLRSLLGKLQFLSTVLPAARPFTRQVIDLTKLEPRARRSRRLPAGFRDEIKLWLSHLDSWNGSRKWHSSSAPFVIASDASTQGFGWVVESVPPKFLSFSPPHLRPGHGVAGVWSGPEASLQSSHTAIGWGELFAAVVPILSSAPLFSDHHIVSVLDNSASVSILNRRTTKSPELLSLLQRLALASAQHNFTFTAVHRPGVHNVLPDILSRPAKHGFCLDPLDINSMVQKELESSLRLPLSVSVAAVPLEAEPAFGSFFLHDHISHAHSSVPLHHLISCQLVFSDSFLSRGTKGSGLAA